MRDCHEKSLRAKPNLMKDTHLDSNHRAHDAHSTFRRMFEQTRFQDGFWSSLAGFFYAALGALLCASVIVFEPNLLEEGLLVHFARRMAAGEALYRDVIFFTGPFPFELLALLYRVLGESVVGTGRGVIVVMAALASVATYQLVRTAGSHVMAHAAAFGMACAPILLFPLLSLYYYSTLAMYLAFFSVYAAVKSEHSNGWALLCGCLLASVVLTKQNGGLILTAGLLLVMAVHLPVRKRWVSVSWTVMGGIGVLVLTMIYYGVQGNAFRLFEALVLMPLRLGDGFSSPYINFFPIGSLEAGLSPGKYLPWAWYNVFFDDRSASAWLVALTQFLYGLPVLALGLAAFRLVVLRNRPAVLSYLSVLVVALWIQMYPRSDWGHLVYVLPPAFVLLLAALPVGPLSRAPRVQVFLAAVLTLILIASSGVIWMHIEHDAEAPLAPPELAQRPVGVMMKNPDLRRTIQSLRDSIVPDEMIWVARAETGIYEAAGARNPTPYGGTMPGLREIQDPTTVAALDQVRYVVMSDADSDGNGYFRENLPDTQRYLERHFTVPESFIKAGSTLLLLERGPDRGPTEIDLFDSQDRSRRFVRAENGDVKIFDHAIPKFETRFNRRPLWVPVAPGGGGIDFDLMIPEDAVLETSVGVGGLYGGHRPFYQVARSRLEIKVARGDSFETLLSVPYDWSDPEVALGWKHFEVDLDRFSGQRVRLRFEVVPLNSLSALGVAWWGSPRIIKR